MDNCCDCPTYSAGCPAAAGGIPGVQPGGVRRGRGRLAERNQLAVCTWREAVHTEASCSCSYTSQVQAAAGRPRPDGGAQRARRAHAALVPAIPQVCVCVYIRKVCLHWGWCAADGCAGLPSWCHASNQAPCTLSPRSAPPTLQCGGCAGGHHRGADQRGALPLRPHTLLSHPQGGGKSRLAGWAGRARNTGLLGHLSTCITAYHALLRQAHLTT